MENEFSFDLRGRSTSSALFSLPLLQTLLNFTHHLPPPMRLRIRSSLFHVRRKIRAGVAKSRNEDGILVQLGDVI